VSNICLTNYRELPLFDKFLHFELQQYLFFRKMSVCFCDGFHGFTNRAVQNIPRWLVWDALSLGRGL